jgi:hypothetical protein
MTPTSFKLLERKKLEKEIVRTKKLGKNINKNKK